MFNEYGNPTGEEYNRLCDDIHKLVVDFIKGKDLTVLELRALEGCLHSTTTTPICGAILRGQMQKKKQTQMAKEIEKAQKRLDNES